MNNMVQTINTDFSTTIYNFLHTHVIVLLKPLNAMLGFSLVASVALLDPLLNVNAPPDPLFVDRLNHESLDDSAGGLLVLMEALKAARSPSSSKVSNAVDELTFACSEGTAFPYIS